ncbi:glucokinase [Sphaeroforma arctica JP610]|uniref:Glucokinase n=1 Tax=Sphaeroforma arctica JP610 TaxID=667725 RepID=A0A0L0GDM6_9EUKA|nr:glucokinase [Sphaeroforma arctica JP610]KNC87102.1 glucokinase [Sphaeroforma arctica JP610]|eukprot:XP_014161004.1 glucokinase [Sphaeroforma arctica JP610]
MGYGLLTLSPDECFALNDVEPVEGAPVATIGAGTGLGECFLTKDPDADDYVCWATEGGHTDFPPRDHMEVELLKFLREKFEQKSRVSVERVISGPGLSSIYEFLSQRFPQNIDSDGVHKVWTEAGSLKGGVVGMNADKDLLCMKAMEIMMGAYASEAGNAMLKWLPYGGMYITGGIAVKNFKWIANNPQFKEIMFDKGRVSPAIWKCPVYVPKTEDVGERGAHLVAYNLLLSLR